MKKVPSTDGSIDSFCPRCDRMGPHKVVTVKGENVLKVTCHACNESHKFLTAKPLSKAEQTKARQEAAAVRRTEMRKASFDEALSQLNLSKARPYNLAEGGYRINDLINHQVFGYGIVDEVEGRSKMVVRFREGHRRLVFNYSV